MASVGARLRSRLAAGRSPAQFGASSTTHSTTTSRVSSLSSSSSPIRESRTKTTTTTSSTSSSTSSSITTGLSEKDQRDLRTAFVILDQDGDGKLGSDDMLASLQQLGYDVNSNTIDKFIDKVTHGGSFIKENEFTTWLEAKSNGSTTSIIQNAFATLDRDNDGYITKSDLQFGLEVAHENLSPVMISLMFDEADQDQDGKIDIKDFMRALGEL